MRAARVEGSAKQDQYQRQRPGKMKDMVGADGFEPPTYSV